MAGARLIILDFIMSFAWVWSRALNKIFIQQVLGLGHEVKDEVIRCALSIANMFLFAFLVKITKGATYNPLTVLSSAFSWDSSRFLFTVGARIPAQVIGSIIGVRLIMDTFPEIGHGPRLNVDIRRGALTEGFLTFTIVMISLELGRKIPGSSFMKTWISSVSKLTFHILGSDLTGGCMNPASVIGWAYARGDYISKEHILVYWIAPIEGTLLAAWTFRLIVRAGKAEKANIKSD